MPNASDNFESRELRLDEAAAKYFELQATGAPIDRTWFLGQFSDLAEELEKFLNDLDQLRQVVEPEEQANSHHRSTLARQNGDTSPTLDDYSKRPEIASNDKTSKQQSSGFNTYISQSTIGDQQIGRYRLVRVLGEGAFGRVYLGFDEELQRQVAIKVPTEERFQKPEDAQQYLEEARKVASLHHPNIVPVYDTGRTEDGSIYVISKFIEGGTLGDRIKNNRPDHDEAAKLIALCSQALQHAHNRRLIHRDIKPNNILIEESSGAPYVCDFGLAIREEDCLNDSKIAGTPAYMSPEQARGEGHRLDGRSDIFSLGVVLYQLLTGNMPFRGSTANELFHQVISVQPKTLREVDASIPLELERICLKAMSKRASDRYPNATEFADELLNWQQGPEQETRELTIVPKGLRSFDDGDADFFLDLLPGARNRAGLPESIQFWKTRIEETDSDKTFSVGLIYGPSGCGKSSLVKAGLLPRLSKDVVAVYIEAAADETQTRILRGLRKQSPELPNELGFVESFAWLRRSEGRKVVFVLDQFEQWLQAHRGELDSDLVAALRQCDGGTLQAVVMVRDDFAMAAACFMDSLDIPIVQGHNFATVDLFDVDHAQKVLTKFGQAFGKLSAQTSKLTEQEQEFVFSIASGLAQDGKVVSVQLALFAEMVKGKRWVPTTLQEVGGTEGIGVNFLDETFSSRTANPKHRLHQEAARQVLNALLPEFDSDIKRHMRSHAELLDASGYQDRPREFNDLLRILDGELRLITPTDPESFQTKSGSDPSAKFYQLTHDYLVPSLREWLTSKQQETRTGRAKLKLAERSSQWNAKSENRHLPSLSEWLSICMLTDSRQWKAPQREMMRRAGRLHRFRSGLALVALAVFTTVGMVIRGQVLQQQEATRIEGLVGRLVSAEPSQLSEIVKDLNGNQAVAANYLLPLVSADAKTGDEKRAQLHARLATVARDKSLVEPLLEELLTNKVAYIAPIRQQLRPNAWELTEKLQAILRDEKAEVNRRFRAAVALADFIPESEAASWTPQDLRFVAEQLVSTNAEFQPLLREDLLPIRGRLLGDLEKIFGDAQATSAQRLSAANAFVDYAASDIPMLSQLLTVATPEQYAVLYPLVEAAAAPSTVEDLSKIAATLPPDELGSVERVRYGQRRANAAVTLLRLGEREKVLSVFDMSDDPESLTQFTFRCRDRSVRVEELLNCLRVMSDAPVDRFPRHTRYALLLTLGEYSLNEVPDAQRETLLKQLGAWYRDDPSSGVHGAAGWLLRQWGQNDVVTQVDQTAVPYSVDREWFTLAIKIKTKGESASFLAGLVGSANVKMFYYTFIVFPAGDYTIGSVVDEADREKDEVRHRVQLTSPFALLDREITMEELIAFSTMSSGFMQQADAQQTDAKPQDAGFAADWYDSVGFCRWLTQQSGLSERDQSYADPESLDKERYPREPNPSANWAPRNWPLELGRRGFRLPTESEWEVACRAGARTAYGYGSDVTLLDRFGWSLENSGKRAHPPRELRPGSRGLFDLHGNLFEWTHDWKGNFGEADVVDPLGATGGSDRVRRGGSWGYDAADCRSAHRHTNEPTIRSLNSGFRLALSSPFGQSQDVDVDKAAEPVGEGTKGARR